MVFYWHCFVGKRNAFHSEWNINSNIKIQKVSKFHNILESKETIPINKMEMERFYFKAPLIQEQIFAISYTRLCTS